MVDIQRLRETVQFLVGVNPPRNFENPEVLNSVATYIANAFRQMGYVPQLQTFIAGGNEYCNVLCRYQPEKPKQLVIGAHYDVCENSPGADDNASAVAGLLEIARCIQQSKLQLDFGIEFVAYSLEERTPFGESCMGSFVHAKNWMETNSPENFVGMVCLEMIGYFSDEPGSQPYPPPFESLAKTFPSKGNFIAAVGSSLQNEFELQFSIGMKESYAIDVQPFFPPAEFLPIIKEVQRSDHINYWRYKLPALMITDTAYLRNPNYHKLTDTIDTLNFEKIGAVVRAICHAIEKLTIN